MPSHWRSSAGLARYLDKIGSSNQKGSPRDSSHSGSGRRTCSHRHNQMGRATRKRHVCNFHRGHPFKRLACILACSLFRSARRRRSIASGRSILLHDLTPRGFAEFLFLQVGKYSIVLEYRHVCGIMHTQVSSARLGLLFPVTIHGIRYSISVAMNHTMISFVLRACRCGYGLGRSDRDGGVLYRQKLGKSPLLLRSRCSLMADYCQV